MDKASRIRKGTDNMDEIRNEIIEFIKDTSRHKIEIDNKYLVTKQIYRGNVFIYYTEIYPPEMQDLIFEEWQGFYNLKTNKFYDLGAWLHKILGIRHVDSCELLKERIIEGITNKVSEELAMNNQKYFKEPIELNKELSESLEYWEKNRAINNARIDFFTDNIRNLNDFIELDFINNGIKQIGIDEIIEYIEEPEKLLEHYKNEFLNKSIEKLYFDFRTYKAYEKEIMEIENDKSNILHRQKFVERLVENIVTYFPEGYPLPLKTDKQDYYSLQGKDRIFTLYNDIW